MPTYEYACKQCGEHLEVFQSFSEDALTECPNCHGQLRKVFGAVGVTFKGAGFYKTDSRKSTSTAPPTSVDSSGEKPTETKSSDNKSGDSGSPEKKAETSSGNSSDKAAS